MKLYRNGLGWQGRGRWKPNKTVRDDQLWVEIVTETTWVDIVAEVTGVEIVTVTNWVDIVDKC